jgi:endogenous inhibitor of DNA gyrase (YacG/DUF329 family)
MEPIAYPASVPCPTCQVEVSLNPPKARQRNARRLAFRYSGKVFCCRPCASKDRTKVAQERRQQIKAGTYVPEVIPASVPCPSCGEPVALLGPRTSKPRQSWKRFGKAYCNRACVDRDQASARSVRLRTVALTREHNPMENPAILEKMRATLKRIGHRPKKQGGNGRGLAPAEAAIQAALAAVGIAAEPRVIGTGKGARALGLPQHFKLDLVPVGHQVAIEVDGSSHQMRSRRAQDAKKTAWLVSQGWTVLRFSNQQALTDSVSCVQTVMSTISRLSSITPT